MLLRKILHTADDGMLTLLRLVLGILFFAHGAQKALGWFGGPGFDATITQFGQNLAMPPFLAVLAILAEFLGGIGLIFGFLSRIAALGIIVNMVVAILLVHGRFGIFMNWTGQQPGEGFEYHLLAIAIASFVVARGAGAFSVDRVLEAKSFGGTTVHIHMEPQPSR